MVVQNPGNRTDNQPPKNQMPNTDILINTQTLLPTDNSSLVPFLPAVPSEDAKIPLIIADRLMVGILLGVKNNELV